MVEKNCYHDIDLFLDSIARLWDRELVTNKVV